MFDLAWYLEWEEGGREGGRANAPERNTHDQTSVQVSGQCNASS
eukprot:SAG31_NODE_11260_length_1048_cov_8.361433_1_plen_43_part_01